MIVDLLKAFEFKRNKKQLKIMYTNYLYENEPQINTVDTYFTDAIFVTNNPSIGLDLYDIITDDDSIVVYHKRLIQHFISKGCYCK